MRRVKKRLSTFRLELEFFYTIKIGEKKLDLTVCFFEKVAKKRLFFPRF